jgi:carbonic anhydrase
MKAHSSATQASTTPMQALAFLKEGNTRFVNNLKANRDLLQQANDTRDGQFPFAVILSCI